jgi:branched-chain amino acid transport system permease protein
MIGGLIIGVVEALSSTYLTTNVSQIFINLVLILILIFKPYGLFGKGARVA